jgi:uncharacterized protein (TIGR03435 family)
MRVRPLAGHVFTFVIATSTVVGGRASAQTSAHAEFDVVSIKRVDEIRQSGGGRTLPDGTIVMMNRPVATFIQPASPVPVVDVIGLPEWTRTERYDVTMKPPAGSTREQISEMWRTMFAERMQLTAHVEQQQRDVFSLILARSDGRLGPDLKPSTLDCTPRPIAPSTPPPPATAREWQGRCGMFMSAGSMVSGGVAMDQFVLNLGGLAGGTVENHTGLDGPYAVTLRFSPARQLGASGAATADDAPDFFTAVQEQLGLKLQREKKMMPVFVIDHIERPTDN